MKKLYFIFATIAVGLLSSSISAQNSEQNFKPSWFIGANGGINWYLAEGNNLFNEDINAELTKKFGYQANAVVGYHFSPVNALRGMIGYNEFKYQDPTTMGNSYQKIPNVKFNLDYVLNLTNWVKGYNPKRVFTFSLFAGLGAAYIDRNVNESNFGGALRGGLQGDFNINPKLAINLILDGNLLTDNFNDWNESLAFDANAGLSLGLTYRFQKNEAPKTVAPALLEPVEPQPATVVPEPKPVEPEQPKVVEPEPIVETPTAKEDVFFKFNSKVPEGATQEENMQRIADYLKNNPNAKIVVSGYADDKTGNDAINERVSKQRAENVAKKLVDKYGVDADRLLVKWHGSKVQPYQETWQNRVVILETATEEQIKSYNDSLTSNDATRVEINFEPSSSDITTDKQKEALAKIAKFLNENPSTIAIVDGYASNNTGTVEYNDELSKKRAVKVANTLISEYDIKLNRIKVGWFGGRVQPHSEHAMNQVVIVKAK